MARRTAAKSTDLIATELNDRLGVGNRAIRLTPGVVVGRGAALESVGVARRDVVQIEVLGSLDQARIGLRLGRQGLQQGAERVSPRLQVEFLENGLDRLLRGLVGRERRPLVESALARAAGLAKVHLRLPEPVA